MVKALSRHGVTLKVLQQLLDEGCLREELSKLGIQGIPARAIETTLLEWNTKGRANATQEVRGNQVGSEVAASDDGEGRPHDAGVVIDKLAAAKEDVSQLKAAAPIDEDASLTSVITNGGLADAIVTALRPVMHVLEGVPLVGTVARLVSGAISGVAHVRVAEQAVGEYQALVSGVPDLLAAAAGTLGDNHAAQEILRGMRDALAAGNEVVGVLMSRGWLGKWVRAPRDAGDLEGTSRRIADLLSQLTLAASLEGTRTAQNVNAAVARMNEAMQSGILSLAPIRDAISRALDDAGGIEVRGFPPPDSVA